MVNFRIHGNFDHLFDNLVIPRDEDWASLDTMVFLGRYMKEKSSGLLYRTRILYQHPDFKTRGYHIDESSKNPRPIYPNHFPLRLPSQGLKDIYSYSTRLHMTLDIIFRNREDYLKAEKELNICQTHSLEIPSIFSQLKVCTPEIYKRFENLVENMEETLYLYKPSN